VTEFAPTDTTVANVPDYREDNNSPAVSLSTTSLSATLAGQYDLVKMVVSNVRGGVPSGTIELQVNGLTGPIYRVTEQSGQTINNQTSVQIAKYGDNNLSLMTPVEITLVGDIDSADLLGGSVQAATHRAAVAQSFSIPLESPPLNSVRIFEPNNNGFAATLELYGRTV